MDIYDDVIRTEDRETVEMIVAIYESADCVRDHDFRTEANTHQPLQHTGSDSVKIRSSRAAAVCLVLLCVLLLTAVIVPYVHLHTNYTQETHQLLTKITNLTEERDQLLTKITDLTKERYELLTKNINLTNERDGLLTKNDNLTTQRQQFIQERNELVRSLHEIDGWLYSNFSFYFISSLKKSWTESRIYCMEREADLIIINNREEQEFAKKFSHGNEFWIGLTDSDEESKWKWVDGSTLTSGFWGSREPNGYSGENCVVSFSSGWCDYPCDNGFKWICEKKIFSNELHINLTTNM